LQTLCVHTSLKTHPLKREVTLKGTTLSGRKDSYAEWQLVEEK